MTKFIQLHLLTSYPPSNLNRDDLGRPKTATMGGTERLRVSSQSLKRTWRTSDLFENAMSGHIGTRTKRLGSEAEAKLIAQGVSEKNAKAWAIMIASEFGKAKKDSTEIEQLAHISPEEQQLVDSLITTLAAENRAPEEKELMLLRAKTKAVDIALFGRMLASSPEYNIEAACQVAHGISVHSVAIEDDYFTAVDDLNSAGDQGAAHIGEAGFAAALFYSYICIDKELLVDNLDGDVELATKAVAALTEAAVKVSPKGKQNTFASRAYASYVLAEKGAQQPRSLSVAFLEPIHGNQQAVDAIAKLTRQVENFDKVYGDCADSRMSLNAITGEGDFNALKNFIAD
ncbi:type I-E CRISPR-associated protein Cas7/Cse4/CasC [Shewanella sp. Isolate7]|uniref:type I-E CRISPR-associated protein Cas7/Cse4/CasC n=1 Tax=Shewanella sp. Isolate7 TaxID=2908528 RepID=UPI001EFEB958|nr:type I-E CRISPR-associated protein Cas7/Cse4/CasC [Shewanella sp. Isolate7]MCG9722927.1 type I-E CRISPR-associated protein Cas7/Cse4/CasC [Shewanella sp. Isolate7]